MPSDRSNDKNDLTHSEVLRFLRANPGFFEQYDSILPTLRIPHRSGSATSLIERQVSVLRDRCDTLQSQLHDFIEVARENEELHLRMHALMQNIVSARSLSKVLSLTQDSLANNFNADGVTLLLAGQPARPEVRRKSAATRKKSRTDLPDGVRILAEDHPLFELFDELFISGATRCGLPSNERLKAIAGSHEANVASAALIPLEYKRRIGIVMLSSRDVERFASGKGVMFLDQFGGLLSRRLQAMRIVAPDDADAIADTGDIAASSLTAETREQEAQS